MTGISEVCKPLTVTTPMSVQGRKLHGKQMASGEEDKRGKLPEKRYYASMRKRAKKFSIK
jgi:hypothetical protein